MFKTLALAVIGLIATCVSAKTDLQIPMENWLAVAPKSSPIRM